MREFTSQEIIKILDHLIGPTEAIGESHVDERIYENFKILIDVTNWCMDEVRISSQTSGSPYWSMHKVGFEAKCALAEWRDWLNVLCEEKE